MTSRLRALPLAALAWLGAVLAAPAAPRTVADIPPVHSLVAMVMAGAGAPGLAVPPGASPHGFALRPSQAGALAEAELAVWIGPRLAPWFEQALAALAPEARSLALMAVPGTELLPIRTEAAFGREDHGHDHAEGGAMDEHAWLDPRNAAVWLEAIAEALAAEDPANAALYRANAAAGRARLAALEAELIARLAPVADRPFAVFHDAYRYFEHRFALNVVGAVTSGDARGPGAGRLSALRERLAETGAVCLFSEPQFAPRLAATVAEGTGVRQGVLDPLGARLEPGPELYPTLLRNLAEALIDCLGGG